MGGGGGGVCGRGAAQACIGRSHARRNGKASLSCRPVGRRPSCLSTSLHGTPCSCSSAASLHASSCRHGRISTPRHRQPNVMAPKKTSQPVLLPHTTYCRPGGCMAASVARAVLGEANTCGGVCGTVRSRCAEADRRCVKPLPVAPSSPPPRLPLEAHPGHAHAAPREVGRGAVGKVLLRVTAFRPATTQATRLRCQPGSKTRRYEVCVCARVCPLAPLANTHARKRMVLVGCERRAMWALTRASTEPPHSHGTWQRQPVNYVSRVC